MGLDFLAPAKPRPEDLDERIDNGVYDGWPKQDAEDTGGGQSPKADPMVAIQLVNYKWFSGYRIGETTILPDIGHAAIEDVRVDNGVVLSTLHGHPKGPAIPSAVKAVLFDNVPLAWSERDYYASDYGWSPADELDRKTIAIVPQSELGKYQKARLDALTNTFSDDSQYEVPIFDDVRYFTVDNPNYQNSNAVAAAATFATKVQASVDGRPYNVGVSVGALKGTNPGEAGHLGPKEKVTSSKPNKVVQSDPIFIDLNGDGSVFRNEIRKFDWSGDGNAENTVWMNPEDALLVFDLSASGKFGQPDGVISRRDEIVFTDHVYWARTDLHALRAYDYAWINVDGIDGGEKMGGNKDGILSKDDAIWSTVRLWQDKNGDAVFQKTELLTPQQAGLQSIDLDYVNVDQQNGGHFGHGAWHFPEPGSRFSEAGIEVHGLGTATLTSGDVRIYDTSILSVESNVQLIPPKPVSAAPPPQTTVKPVFNPIMGTKGGSGNDLITGTSRGDDINGGSGDDYIIAGSGDDWQVRGGKGADVFAFSKGDQKVYIRDFNEGEDKIDLVGLAYSDLEVYKNPAYGKVDLWTSGRADRLVVYTDDVAAFGQDDVFAPEDRPTQPAPSSQTSYTPIGGTTGGAGNDLISGTSGSDNIDGGGGNDYIDAGRGDDWQVRGGTGADVFAFSKGDDKVYIRDFTDDLDKIDLIGLAYSDLEVHKNEAYGKVDLWTAGRADRLVVYTNDVAGFGADDIL